MLYNSPESEHVDVATWIQLWGSLPELPMPHVGSVPACAAPSALSCTPVLSPVLARPFPAGPMISGNLRNPQNAEVSTGLILLLVEPPDLS